MPMETDTTDLIARARSGDQHAFRDLVQRHSHELQVHCYRILGSLQDAEDALQETLVSAWRNLGEFGERSSLRTWLYKIATNRCLSMLRADSRRPRVASAQPDVVLPEATGTDAAPPWLEPYPDVLLDHLVDQRPGPEARYETTEAVSLAFITALQLLPPRQRAALVLRDVLGYHAAEVAQMLDSTPESVSSALKRARATVENHLKHLKHVDHLDRPEHRDRPGTAAEHRLVARFTDALERADLNSLIDLLVTDVRLSMPPAMLEYRGVETARRLLAATAFRPGRSFRVVPTRANGQPAFGLYLADPHAGVYRAYCLLVITPAGDHIGAITSFTTEVMTRFGLPRTHPGSRTAPRHPTCHAGRSTQAADSPTLRDVQRLLAPSRREEAMSIHPVADASESQEPQELREPQTTLGPFSSPGASPTPWAATEWALRSIQKFQLCTVRADGRPHVTPLLAVWALGAMWFTTGDSEQKAKNLAANPHCSLTTGTGTLTGTDYVVEGTASLVADQALRQTAATAFEQAYGRQLTGEDGTWYRLGDAIRTGKVQLYRVQPDQVFAFGIGNEPSQTRYRWT